MNRLYALSIGLFLAACSPQICSGRSLDEQARFDAEMDLRSIDLELRTVVKKIVEDLASLIIPVVSDEATVLRQLRAAGLPNVVATRAVINTLIDQLRAPENHGWQLKFYTVFAKFFSPSLSWPNQVEVANFIAEIKDADAVFSAIDSPKANLIRFCEEYKRIVMIQPKATKKRNTGAIVGAALGGATFGCAVIAAVILLIQRQRKTVVQQLPA